MATTNQSTNGGPGCRGKTIAVVSSKGGAGTTTVATNFALDLAVNGRSVCLADLVLGDGSIASFLNVAPACSISELAQSCRRNDPLALDRALVRHVSGLHVLCDLFGNPEAPLVKPADIDDILDRLMHSFDFVVLDAPKVFDDLQLLILDRADVVVFVIEMDLPSLQGARRTLEFWERIGVDLAKLRVCLNRYISERGMGIDYVEQILGRSVFWTVPDNYRAVMKAVNQGLSLGAADCESDVARSCAALSHALIACLPL
jgi:pilus assembly protein CpaE